MFSKAALIVILFAVSAAAASKNSKHIHCRDPDLGGQPPTRKHSQRKFLVLTGGGAGLGNYLIFYPAAYYFAALTGRDILIQDGSLLAEMCSVITCGYPLYSEMAAAFPSVLDNEKLARIKGMNAFAMRQHISGENVANEQLLRADGYKYMSGWYLGYNHTEDCIAQLTGCAEGDVSCHDRYALQRLVRGPFKSEFSLFKESRVIGVPTNLKHALMTLPHAYAPRFDASIHLRCQFKHFEYLVGPDDATWPNYVKEVDDWLGSTAFNAGMGVFRAIESKIMRELRLIKTERAAHAERRRLMVETYNQHARRLMSAVHNTNNNNNNHHNRNGTDKPHRGEREREREGRGGNRGAFNLTAAVAAVNVTQLDYIHENSVYNGNKQDRIYVYLASDNERVKEALSAYLLGHKNISVMRVKSLPGDHIVHAKNIGYVRENANNTGMLNLVLDWYAMSLSNVVFAWRRDTDLLSTFAQSSQRMSGNTDVINSKILGGGGGSSGGTNGEKQEDSSAENKPQKEGEGGSDNDDDEDEEEKNGIHRSKGFQLVFHNHRTLWREF